MAGSAQPASGQSPPTQPSLALIVAMDRSRAIGSKGGLPWHLPDDLRNFKQITVNHPILMGRKTFESIGRPLPQRRNLVLSRDPNWNWEGVERVANPAEALRLCAVSEWLMVIGGGQIYVQCLPLAARIYLCEVDTQVVDADTWFPDFDRDQWQELSRIAHPADDKHAYAFDQIVLQRRT